MQWHLIKSDSALETMLERFAGAPAVAVDTEFMRRNTFFPEVALVQLCFGDEAWLVDPLQLSNLQPLRRLMQDPNTVKVLHSPSEDLEVFDRWLGVLPEPLFDTQRAAALLNMGFGIGYRALVLACEGVDIPKDETRSDWLQRPLSAAQCEYAAQDVAHLLPVWQRLAADCAAQGKLDWLLADGADVLATYRAPPGSGVARIKSAWKLDRRATARLIALCAWRETAARERNKPRGWVIDDAACFGIAEADPQSMTALEKLGLLSGGSLRRDGNALLELLATQRDCPEDQLPGRLPQPLDPAGRKLLQALKHRAREIASELNAAPEALLAARDYELLLRQQRGEVQESPINWSGWRAEKVIAPLRKLLEEKGL